MKYLQLNSFFQLDGCERTTTSLKDIRRPIFPHKLKPIEIRSDDRRLLRGHRARAVGRIVNHHYNRRVPHGIPRPLLRHICD